MMIATLLVHRRNTSSLLYLKNLGANTLHCYIRYANHLQCQTYRLLSVDDFSGMKVTSNMKCVDYLLAVSETSYLKSMYGEEDNLIDEQDKEFRINKEERITHNIRSILSSFPQVVDKENSVHDFGTVVPKKKRSIPKARSSGDDDDGESIIKKAVELKPNKIKWSAIATEFVRPIGISIHSQELLENRVKAADNRENRGIKINYRGSTSFVPLPVNGKRSREDRKSEATRQKKRNIIARVVPVGRPVVIINRELSVEFKNLITENGGLLESAKLVIEKTLFKTDVEPAEGRFSIPQNQRCNMFLNPDEEEHLNRCNGKKMCEMNVMLIEPLHQIGEINLRKWTMNKDNGKANASYVLVKHWNDVRRRNHLKIGMKMQLWAFRKEEKLCFALVNA